MTICNKCGNPLDVSFRFCSGCGARVPGWTGPEVTPSPETDTNDPPERPTPPVNSEKRNEPVPHPFEERLQTLEESIVGWINKNRRLSLILTILGLVLGVGSLWFVNDFFERRKNPPPDAVFIDVEKNATEVEAGAQLRLTARTSPENLACNFRWGPPDMIEGDGASVWFKPPKDNRHSPYAVVVTLQTVDLANTPGPSAPPRSITVLPEGHTNNKPEFNPDEGIHIEGSPEVQSGSSINLDALAFDKDGDPLKYSWSVEGSLVQIDRNGERRVTLKLPKGFARRGDIYVTVKLIVSDGKGGFSEPQRATLKVTPEGHLQISRIKRTGNPKATPSPAAPSQPAQPTSPPPLAVPQATQAGGKSEQVSRP